MSNWFTELSYTEEELHLLNTLGLRATQVKSWRYSERSLIGYIELLERAGIVSNTGNDLGQTFIPEISLAHKFDQILTLEQYFARFTEALLAKIGIDDFSHSGIPEVIAFNLVPFFIRAANASKIARAITTMMSTSAELKTVVVVLFTKTHSLFSSLPVFKDLVEFEKGPSFVSIIDTYGNLVKIQRNVSDASMAGAPEKPIRLNARGAIEQILLHDDISLRDALIYDTNINIGHFDVGSCHVRTHYELEDFVKYNSVFESIYKRFCDFVSSYSRVVVVATGLESEALITLGNSFQSRNSDGPKEKITIEWRTTLTHTQFEESRDTIEHWFRGVDLIVVLSDVINSGNTVNSLVAQIKELLRCSANDTEDNSDDMPDVLPFSVVKMSNSPESLYACVKLGRPYLSNDKEECPLCNLGQPLLTVSPETWRKDFRKVDSSQLTPLDFWEMVEDCDAWKCERPGARGEVFIHRVDTSKMMSQYRNWLINLIKAKYTDSWGETQLDVIISLSESTSEKFASLAREACGKQFSRVLSLERVESDGGIELSNDKSGLLKDYAKSNAKVIIVDDGINTGKTIYNLVKLVRSYSIEPLGVIVLDNRMSSADLQSLFPAEDAINVVALYNWPSCATVIS